MRVSFYMHEYRLSSKSASTQWWMPTLPLCKALQTLRLFFSDMAKSTALGLVLLPPLIYVRGCCLVACCIRKGKKGTRAPPAFALGTTCRQTEALPGNRMLGR
jgi:hypothetical protein